MYGICNLAIIPLRAEPNDRSEMVSQVLFGEHFEVLETQKNWSKIKLFFDNYEGWIDSKQIQIIKENEYNELSNSDLIYNADLIEYVSNPLNMLIPIPLGSSLSFLNSLANSLGIYLVTLCKSFSL
jgi:hypothetical protein